VSFQTSRFSYERGEVNRIINEIKGRKSFKEIDVETIDSWGETLGKMLSRNLKTSQIRRIFSEFKKLHTEIKSGKVERIREKVLLLKPRLAYVAGRHAEAKPLTNVLSEGIKKIADLEDYERFFQLFEAILAYHKYYGGKD